MTKKIKQLSPIVTMVILVVIVALATLILSILNLDGTQTSVVNGSLETSIVVVKNIFSGDGIAYLFSNLITNLSLLTPILLLILSFLATSIAKSSGLLKHLFIPLKKIKPGFLTFIIIIIGVISTIIGNYAYIILLPLVTVLYEYLGRSKTNALLTLFLGITIGYGTGIFYNHNDFSLGVLTQTAAIINVDENYRHNLYSNLYIMLFSTVLISYIMSLLINKRINKEDEPYTDELIMSKKGLLFSLISMCLVLIPIIIGLLPKYGFLLDNTATVWVAKIFNSSAPFNQSFMFFYLIILSVGSVVYGLISRNFKNTQEINKGFNLEFGSLGYMFVLLLLISIITGIIDWSNLGIVMANKLMGLLSIVEFTGIPLIIITFIIIIIMGILIPGAINKWAIMSPLLIPLFMRANISPAFTEFIFKVADSIGKALSPFFIFYVVMIGLFQKHKEIGYFTMIKKSLPIIIIMAIIWLLTLIIWYISGLPLGIGSYATM